MKNLLPICMMAIVLPTTTWAQWNERDPENSIFQSEEEYNQFMGDAKRSIRENPEMKAMIPMLNDLALGRSFGATAKRFGSEASTIGLLSNRKIREDLEMVDDQYKELQQMNADIQKRVAEQLRSLDFSNSKDIVVQLRQVREDARKELDELLLPHQVKRLQQIRIQSQLRRRNLVDILTSNPYRDELDITDEQSERLRETQAEIEADLEKQIARLRQQARDRLLSNLKPDQQSQVEEMIGDAFEFESATKTAKPTRKNGAGGRKRFPGKGK